MRGQAIAAERCSHRAGAPSIALLTRLFTGRVDIVASVLAALPCHFAALGAGVSELVYVLDAEAVTDHQLGNYLLASAANWSVGKQVRVIYERLPAAGWSVFDIGHDRSQYSSFISDAHTNACVIGFFDAEVHAHA